MTAPSRYAFSFSGLKTAVLRAVQAPSPDLERRSSADIARGFQDAALDVLVAKTAHAVEALGYRQAMIGGGVACNRALVAPRSRERLAGQARVSVASPRLNTDNAAMIAAAGAWRLARGERSGWDLEPRDDLPLPGLVPVSHSTDPCHDRLPVHHSPRPPRDHRLRAHDDGRVPDGRLADRARAPASAGSGRTTRPTSSRRR